MKRALCAMPLAAVLLAAGCSPSKTDVATVDGKAITKDDVAARLLQGPEARPAVRNLILAQILQSGADKAKVTVTDVDVNRYLQIRKDQYPPGRFDEAMATSGTTDARLRADARTDLLMRGLEMKDVKVSDESIKKYYDADNGHVFDKPEWVQFGIVVAKDKADAQNATRAIKDGADFTTVAGKFSIPQARMQGVGLEWVGILAGTVVNEQRQPSQNLDPTVAAAIKKTPEGACSTPLAIKGTPYFQVMYVRKRVAGAKYPLDQVKPEIAYAIANQNSQLKRDAVDKLLKDAKIDIKSDQFKGLDKPENLIPRQGAMPPQG